MRWRDMTCALQTPRAKRVRGARPSLAKSTFGQVWPDQVWPRPSLARPSLAKTKFGQVWPNVDRNILESQSTKMPQNKGKQEKNEKEGKQTISRKRKISLPQGKEHENAKWRGGEGWGAKCGKGGGGSRMGTINIVRVSVKASPAEGRRRLHTNTAYVRLSGFNRRSCGKCRRCST